MQNKGLFSVLAVFLVLSIASPSTGSTLMDKETTLNVQAGLIGPGTFWVGQTEVETDVSFGLGGGLDYKLAPKFSGGVACALNNFSGYEDSAMMFEIGFMLKAWINREGSNLLFRPGFGIGAGFLGSLGAIEPSNYLVINGTIEMILLSETGLNWLVLLGITGAPTGGNDSLDMTYGPGFIFRGGVAF